MDRPPPSSALLSFLAVLATGSLGSPTPLPFLCPPLNYNKRDIPYSLPTPCPLRIPNKFVRCDDGLWRRAEVYSLYGSTLACSSCQPTPPPSPSDVPSEFATSMPTDDIRASLPLGWNPMPQQDERRTLLILALSLVLAFLICAFIIGCVFWRKKIIKLGRKDLEAEFKKPHSVPLAEEAKNVVEKENKSKLKIWARATARWKTTVRHAARQRKGQRVASSKSSQSNQPSHLSNHSRGRTLSLPSPSQPIIGECLSSMSLPRDTPTISPLTNAAISPPAYHHGGEAYSLDRPSSSIDPHSSTHAGHVATDDKTLLAHLANLASMPPDEVSIDALEVCDTLVSVPPWHDELEDIPLDLIISNDHPPDNTYVTASLFPPPPSKERMATTDLYDYSFSFEDTAALETEPSAPPFHPPLDDHQIVPSAPPLLDEIEFFPPSAPRFDVGEENPVAQDHDRMASGLPSSANISLSASHEQDIIMLPGYRP